MSDALFGYIFIFIINRDIMMLCPDLSQRTVERALKDLQDHQKISQVGAGRSTKYINR
ncbi:hypothetical protein ACLGL1_04415 [Peptococcus simiae]|uniref:hypothetical protein n=1 Tax=Peptococcus simiae TaxID=1643805 RepID=UPI00397F7973